MPPREKGSDLTHTLKPETPSKVVGPVADLQDSKSFREPLPSASDLAEYEKIHPGAADRIIGIVEKGLSLDVCVHERETAITRHRLIASIIVSLFMISTAVAALVFGPAWLSIPFGFGGILALALRDLLDRDKS